MKTARRHESDPVPRARISPLLPACAILAAAAHVGVSSFASLHTPDYLWSTRAISDLGTQGRPWAALVNVGAMVVPGLLMLAAALLASRQLATSDRARAGLTAMAAAGAALVVAGRVPFPSPVHLAAAIAAAIGCGVATALFAPWAGERLGSHWWRVAGFGCAALLLADAAAWIVAEGLRAPLHTAMGAEQRAASYATFLWWAAVLTALARRERAALRPPAAPARD